MYVGWRDLKWARGRFALIVSVVVLITVLIGLLTGLTQGLGHQSTSAITGLQSPSLVLAGKTFDESVLKTDAIAGATPLGLSTLRAGGNDGSGAAAIIGLPTGAGGAAVAPDSRGIAPGTVVLSEAAAEAFGTSDLHVTGKTFTVAATRGDASYSHQPVIWMELGDWQHLTGQTGQATVLAVDKTPQALAGSLPAGMHATTPADAVSAIAAYGAEHGSLLMIRGFLLAISALVIGAFFTVWTIQRSGDIAVLKALGASTGSLLRDALGQAAVVLLIGTGTGAAIALVAGLGAQQAVPFQLGVGTLMLSVLLLVVLGLLGAALAIKQVTKVDPLTALNGK